MSVLSYTLIILVFIVLIGTAYYYTSDQEIIYILKNYDFTNDKGTQISYSDFNLTNGFWSGSYGPKNLYIYEAISSINGIKSNVTIVSEISNTATINGKNIVYDSNKNVMFFEIYDDLINYPEIGSEYNQEQPSIRNINKQKTIFINSDGKSIPITLISENIWGPKNESYRLITKGLSTTINNIFRTIFSIPLIVIPILIDIIIFII
jgi:hypothetical protein